MKMMKGCWWILGGLLLAGSGCGQQPEHGASAMTPARFAELVATPGDNVPLVSELAAAPFWTNSMAHVVLKYQTGKVFTEDIPQTAKTIAGQYIVCTCQSQFYHQPMHSILTFDKPASALKSYSLYGSGHGTNILIASVITYDVTNRTYSSTSTYGDGFREVTQGSYTDTESKDHTEVFQNGVPFMTRDVTSQPVK